MHTAVWDKKMSEYNKRIADAAQLSMVSFVLDRDHLVDNGFERI
jgi:hypothetical protein